MYEQVEVEFGQVSAQCAKKAENLHFLGLCISTELCHKTSTFAKMQSKMILHHICRLYAHVFPITVTSVVLFYV